MPVRKARKNSRQMAETLDFISKWNPTASASADLALIQPIIDAIPIPIFIKDSKGVYQLVNRSYENLHGRTKTDVVGKNVFQLFPGRVAKQYDNMDRTLLSDPDVIQKYDSTFHTVNGRVLEVTKYKSALTGPDGRHLGLVGVIFDITDQKLAKAALNESEKKFRSIIESSPVGMHIYHLRDDDQLVLSEANPAADRILGINHDRLAGLPIEKAFPDLVATSIPEQYKRIARLGGLWNHFQLDYDGEQVNAAYEIHAFQTSPNMLVALILDVTERKRAENALRKAHDELESKVQLRTAELADLNEKLRHEIVERTMAEEAVQNRLQILTRPGMAPEKISFTDLFTVHELQTLQDAFAKATNVASIITMPDGRPITQPSNFCRLCRDVIRSSEAGFANCMKSDALIGRPNSDGPIMRHCLSAGLWDGGASICVADQHIASWLVGQVRDSSMDTDRLVRYALEIGVDPDEALEALAAVPQMSQAQFADICHALFLIANQMSQMALHNILQARSILARQTAEEALRQSEGRLQQLSTKLLIAQEKERKKLAAELHDGIGQSLAAAKYGLDSVLQNRTGSPVERETLLSASEVLKTVIHEVRRMQTELRPQVLDDLGIVATINWFCRKYQKIYTNLTVEKQVEVEEISIPAALKPVIFRIMQEAMNNVTKHSHAKKATLRIHRRNGLLKFSIKDNGVGFVLEEALAVHRRNSGIGLDSMRERAELSGGKLVIDSKLGEGTVIEISWPLN
jgi:PAS domain S-box-containing protein